jgi:hypothetical protein
MLRPVARRDRMIGLFVAGIVLFNPPILNLVGGTFLGWPALFIYLFVTWGGLIGLMGWVSERDGGGEPRQRGRDKG